MKINYKLINPDGGVNLAKKKARLGLCENISPKSPDEFPTEGYIDDLSDVLEQREQSSLINLFTGLVYLL